MSDTNNRPKLAPEVYDVALPKNAYKFRCIAADNEKSKSGSRMAELELEIIENDPVMHNDKPVDINGLTIKSWSVVTEKSLKFANNCRAAFGLVELTADDINVFDAREFLGKTAFGIAQSTLTPQLNEVTKEPIKNPYTGEPMMQVRREITEWIPKPPNYED